MLFVLRPAGRFHGGHMKKVDPPQKSFLLFWAIDPI
jgi:hypothetical protein